MSGRRAGAGAGTLDAVALAPRPREPRPGPPPRDLGPGAGARVVPERRGGPWRRPCPFAGRLAASRVWSPRDGHRRAHFAAGKPRLGGGAGPRAAASGRARLRSARAPEAGPFPTGRRARAPPGRGAGSARGGPPAAFPPGGPEAGPPLSARDKERGVKSAGTSSPHPPVSQTGLGGKRRGEARGHLGGLRGPLLGGRGSFWGDAPASGGRGWGSGDAPGHFRDGAFRRGSCRCAPADPRAGVPGPARPPRRPHGTRGAGPSRPARCAAPHSPLPALTLPRSRFPRSQASTPSSGLGGDGGPGGLSAAPSCAVPCQSQVAGDPWSLPPGGPAPLPQSATRYCLPHAPPTPWGRDCGGWGLSSGSKGSAGTAPWGRGSFGRGIGAKPRAAAVPTSSMGSASARIAAPHPPDFTRGLLALGALVWVGAPGTLPHPPGRAWGCQVWNLGGCSVQAPSTWYPQGSQHQGPCAMSPATCSQDARAALYLVPL